jgi:integrase
MASIRKRPRGDGTVNYSVLYALNGRQSSLPFDSEKAAAAFKAAVDVHGAQKALEMYGLSIGPRRRTGLTVEQWVRHHIDHLTGVEQYTKDKYEAYLRRDIGPHIGGKVLTELSRDDISRWVQMLEKTPHRGRLPAPKTVKNKVQFLAGALNAAVKAGKIPSNPAADARITRTGDIHEHRYLTRLEFDLLLESTTEYWRPMVEFLVRTGFRWGEASALKPSDVNMDEGTVKVARAWKKDSTGYRIGPPKTRKSNRTIKVSKKVLEKLDYSNEWLFVNRDGGPVRYHGFKGRVWDKAVKKAKLEPKPTPHDLRHTHASWLLNDNVPMAVVSRRLGHETIGITVDLYGHIDKSSDEAAAEVAG